MRATQTVFTSAGIGIAGVDQHGANAVALPGVFRQMLTANLHWRGAKPILRKDRTDCGTLIKQQHSQILSVGFANTRFSHTPAHARHGIKISSWRRNQVHGHLETPLNASK